MSTDRLDDAAAETEETETWPELAISLYERLTGRGATISYEFEDMEIEVPNRVGEDADHAHWRVDGTLRVSTDERELDGTPDRE
ncbi:hypothetical protein BRC83_04765 [Halobacteriales archaeon QS_1_68_17]|jgi:hypothetical protein|nr:MAG: hypothetical protein BRC83_04765 [Halobacteriales archaeon QS_1_68_17]